MPLVMELSHEITVMNFGSVLARSMPMLGLNWDIIMLGYNTNSILDIEMIPGCDLRGGFSLAHPTARDLETFAAMTAPVGIYRLRNAFGVCGYIVSPTGAQKLGNACFPLNNRRIMIPALGGALVPYTVDCMMNDAYRTIRAWACFPPLVMTSNDVLSSTTARQPGASA